jgi:hypothetical protein
MRAFSSVGKDLARRDDSSIIAELSRKAGRKLSYLGLPSPWMGDVLAWKPFLARVFAVEQEKRYLSHLMDTAYAYGLVNQVVYFWGDIDEIMKSQVDEYGQSTADVFPIDLINLDYCRGLDYQEFKKLSTLESLITRQRQSLLAGRLSASFPYFLVLLTHNLPYREGDPTAKRKYIRFLIRDVKYYAESLREQVYTSYEWYLSAECPSAYPHKCFVMGKFFACAQRNGFKAVPRKVVQYSGDKDAVMLHYQFQITPVSLRSPVPVDNKLDVIDILNYPVLSCEGEDINPDRPVIRV